MTRSFDYLLLYTHLLMGLFVWCWYFTSNTISLLIEVTSIQCIESLDFIHHTRAHTDATGQWNCRLWVEGIYCAITCIVDRYISVSFYNQHLYIHT